MGYQSGMGAMIERELKPGWRLVRFGDVVRQVKDKVDAKSSGLKWYVAGEHMDTDDLRIRRRGEITDDYLGPAFHMRFKPGHVLYGSRRTYLRKVAVADFEGICANTTFVLESRDPDLLLPELLPFVMQTETFHEFSMQNSKGSVNPYINFSDLTEYEFALPPLTEQRWYADLLDHIEHQHEALVAAQSKLWQLRSSLEKGIFSSGETSEKIRLGILLERGTLSLQTGPFGTVLKAASYTESGHPVVNPSDMVDGRVALDRCRFVGDSDWERLSIYRLETNDMFIGRKGDMQNIVFVEPEYDGFVLGSDCIRFRVHDDTLEPRFLFYFLRAEITRQWLQAQAYGTVMPGINEKLLARMVMRLPGRSVQTEAMEKLRHLDFSKRQLEGRAAESRTMKLSILLMLQSGRSLNS